jgi:hypothetical protein
MLDEGLLEERQASTVVQGADTVVVITSLAFTKAGVVANAASQTSPTTVDSGSETTIMTKPSAPVTTSTTGKSAGVRMEGPDWKTLISICALGHLIF